MLVRWLRDTDPESRKGHILRALKDEPLTVSRLLAQQVLNLPLLFLLGVLVYQMSGGIGLLVTALLIVGGIVSYFKGKKWGRAWFMNKRAHMNFIERACLSSDGRRALTGSRLVVGSSKST